VHVCQPLLADKHHGYWPAGKLNEGGAETGRWQGLLAQPIETKMPLLGALGTDEQCKASGVFEGGCRLVDSGRLR